MVILKSELTFFGTKDSDENIKNKINLLKQNLNKLKFYLIIAGTNTSKIKGISAVGVDSKTRIKTTLADAEFLMFGAIDDFRYKLPLLKAGVTPALISYSCAKLLEVDIEVVPIGITEKPYFRHLKIENENYTPSECISTGKAMPKNRVNDLYEKGFSIGCSQNKPLFISESVPGGTTTAQAVMEAFGFNVSHLTGSSLINPPRKLKKEIIEKGINNANFKGNINAIDVISSLGDPFQAFCLGLLIGARKKEKIVILSGGSQMIALLVLALEFIKSEEKSSFSDGIFIATTDWLVRDNNINRLLNLVANRHNVSLLGLGSCLNFRSSTYKELQDYEKGYVKEGVGAGGFSILAYLKGFNSEEIISECEYNLRRMLKIEDKLKKR